MDSSTTNLSRTNSQPQNEEINLPKPFEGGLSENPAHHSPGCCFLSWAVNHRRSLLNNEDVQKYLTKYILRSKGKNKTVAAMSRPEVEEVATRKMEGPLIQAYLAGSRATFETYKTNALSSCQCPQARLPITASGSNGVGTIPTRAAGLNTATSNLKIHSKPKCGFEEEDAEELEKLGLDLSESDDEF